MAKKIYTTYIVSATSNSIYGLNQDYYFRTEAEAKKELAELKERYKNIPTQKFELTSHTWSNV